jgi:hypothetical protein
MIGIVVAVVVAIGLVSYFHKTVECHIGLVLSSEGKSLG